MHSKLMQLQQSKVEFRGVKEASWNAIDQVLLFFDVCKTHAPKPTMIS